MKHKLLLFSALLFSVATIAQTKPTEEPTPSRIKVYTPSGEASTIKKVDNSYKWAVKTDLFSILTGEFPIIGEFRIAKKFSVEGSAAVTYAFFGNEGLASENLDDNYDNSGTKPALGSAFRAAIKYYPSSDYDAIEGWSFGFQVYSKTTNRDYKTYSAQDIQDINGAKDSKTKTGISLIIGKQIFQDSNITFESFIGIGMANVKREYLTSEYIYVDGNQETIITTKSTKETVPNFQLGFRIGFGN